MATPSTLTTPESRLSGQIDSLSSALDDSLTLAAEFATASKDAMVRRHRELDKAMKIADRSAGVAIALAKLRGSSFTFKVQHESGAPPIDVEAVRIETLEAQIEREMDRDLGPAFTPQEFGTITNEELHTRCAKRQAVRNRRRAQFGLPVYDDEPVPQLASNAPAKPPLLADNDADMDPTLPLEEN